MSIFRTLLSLSFFLLSGISMQASAQDSTRVSGPHWTQEGELERPTDYRQWTFLSSGFDMTYGPAREANAGTPLFTNVFVLPAAYEEFTTTGHWPDGTMFALEIRLPSGESNGEVHGKFQKKQVALEISVRDSERFKDSWGFFDFTPMAASAEMIPYTVDCYACHAKNASVDYTFVQFYPTLIDIAKDKGVFVETAFND